ncbi:MAG: Inositol 2-dehydrogenase/D-chiro-inositol 3-dehydrogenase [Chlamydiae bacterium]|nr:Inositol 2-dehydrogenase/D-chiro-inositol 3-dehydrogenase [Chlamydiota bacterium]
MVFFLNANIIAFSFHLKEEYFNMSDKKIRLGVLSCGRFAQRRILPQIIKIPSFSLCAIHNRTLSKAREIAEHYKIPFYTHIEKDFFDYPHLDAIIICSPNYLHQKHILLSLRNGKAVFSEKPMTPTYEQSQEILTELTEEKTLVIGQCYRFKNTLCVAKKLIKEGKLGNLLSIKVHMHMNIPKTGWRMTKRYGGGVALEIGVHVIDSIRFLTDSEFTSIYSLGKQILDDQQEDIDISFSALAEMKNGLPVSFDASLEAPYSTGFTIVGSKGFLESTYAIRGDDDGRESLTFFDNHDGSFDVPLPKQNVYYEELAHFANVIEGAESQLTPENAAENVKIVEALKLSMSTHKRVNIEDFVLA